MRFLIPETVFPEQMHNSDVFFVAGFRGTGKTSLLRWHAENKRQNSEYTDFILFKSDLTETQKLQISQETGVSWVDVDSKSMEISQDFKSAWMWFVLHKIGDAIKNDNGIVSNESSSQSEKFLKILGIKNENVFKKVIGFMPSIDGSKVRIRADLKFFEAELGGDFTHSGEFGSVTLDALSSRAINILQEIRFRKSIYIYFDELEAFYQTPEQHVRDLRMVRDLLFSVSRMNDSFRTNNVPVNLIAAVRSEVLDAMGPIGQEIERIVHDRGFHVAWHHHNRSIDHPLLQIVQRKIQSSENRFGITPSSNPMEEYFPRKVNGYSIEAFILDRSFYKPRDIVWRLSLAQKLYPTASRFTVDILNATEIEYSSKLWDEIRYELSAIYSQSEIDVIESIFSGGSSAFYLSDIEERLEKAYKFSSGARKLAERRTAFEILEDLYRLGAIGNSFRVGASGADQKNRWSFRGDPTLLSDKRMVLHPALMKRLSAVSPRRRGSR